MYVITVLRRTTRNQPRITDTQEILVGWQVCPAEVAAQEGNDQCRSAIQ